MGLAGPLSYGQITGTNTDLLIELSNSSMNFQEISSHFRTLRSDQEIRTLKNDIVSLYSDISVQSNRSRLTRMIPHILPPAEAIDFLMNELLDLDTPRDAFLMSRAAGMFEIADDIPSQELLASYLASLIHTIRTDPSFAPSRARSNIESASILALANCGASGLSALKAMNSRTGHTYGAIGDLIGTGDALDFLISEVQSSGQPQKALRGRIALKVLAAHLHRIEDETQRQIVLDGIHSLLQSTEKFDLIRGARMAGRTGEPEFLSRLAELAADVSFVDTKGIKGVTVQYYPIGEAAQTAHEFIKRVNDRPYARERHLIETAIPGARRHVKNAEEAIAQGIDVKVNRARLRWATGLLNEELAELAELQAGQN